MSDPDETEGRRLYRAKANALASSQIAIGKRTVKISEARSTSRKAHGKMEYTLEMETTTMRIDFTPGEVALLKHCVRIATEDGSIYPAEDTGVKRVNQRLEAIKSKLAGKAQPR